MVCVVGSLAFWRRHAPSYLIIFIKVPHKLHFRKRLGFHGTSKRMRYEITIEMKDGSNHVCSRRNNRIYYENMVDVEYRPPVYQLPI